MTDLSPSRAWLHGALVRHCKRIKELPILEREAEIKHLEDIVDAQLSQVIEPKKVEYFTECPKCGESCSTCVNHPPGIPISCDDISFSCLCGHEFTATGMDLEVIVEVKKSI